MYLCIKGNYRCSDSPTANSRNFKRPFFHRVLEQELNIGLKTLDNLKDKYLTHDLST